MSNKHQKRIHDEALPRAARAVAQAEESGEEAFVVTPEGVQLVRIVQSMYDTIPPDGSAFLGHNYRIAGVQNVGTTDQIGALTVPQAQALDISEIVFAISYPAGGIYNAVPDYGPEDAIFFRIHIDGRNPWDQFTIRSVAGLPRIEGWDTLNQNLLASWSDTPVHLIVLENQTLTLDAFQRAAFYAQYPNGCTVRAHLRARWLPMQLFRDIIWKNRGGGENE